MGRTLPRAVLLEDPVEDVVVIPEHDALAKFHFCQETSYPLSSNPCPRGGDHGGMKQGEKVLCDLRDLGVRKWSARSSE